MTFVVTARSSQTQVGACACQSGGAATHVPRGRESDQGAGGGAACTSVLNAPVRMRPARFTLTQIRYCPGWGKAWGKETTPDTTAAGSLSAVCIALGGFRN